MSEGDPGTDDGDGSTGEDRDPVGEESWRKGWGPSGDEDDLDDGVDDGGDEGTDREWGDEPDRDRPSPGPEPAPDVGELAEEVRALREQLEEFETDVDDRTVHRSEIRTELRRYVRWKLRRGHARGWGPYLVLLYGTGMTLGAFYYLDGGWSIAAMLVVWTSTLGVYVLMVLAGMGLNLAGLPLWAADKVGRWRGD